jgi:hypothetical protein
LRSFLTLSVALLSFGQTIHGGSDRIVTKHEEFPIESYSELVLKMSIGAAMVRIERSERDVLVEVDAEYPDGYLDEFKVELSESDSIAKIELWTSHEREINPDLLKKAMVVRVAVSDEVPLRIILDLGYTDAEIDLGGLMARNVTMDAGAGLVSFGFSQPNRATLELLDIDAGACKVYLWGLGYADLIAGNVDAGVSEFSFDLSGSWTRDAEIDVSSGLNLLSVEAPQELGVLVKLKGFLNVKELEGMEEAEGGYITPGFNAADHRVVFRVAGALNSLTFRTR